MVDLNAASFHVVFDPGVLKLVDVVAGEIGTAGVPVDLWREEPAGVVSVVQALSGLRSATGDGHLAELSFQMAGAAGSTSAIGFAQTVLSNTQAEAIEAVWIGATVIAGEP